MNALFPWLLFLHVLGAIVAFGPTFAFPLVGAMGGREPQHANFATRVSAMIANRLVYPIGITLPITGAAMIAVTGRDLTSRANWWLGLAIVLYVVAFAYSYFVQNRLVRRAIEMTSNPPPPIAGGPGISTPAGDPPGPPRGVLPGTSGPPPGLPALVRRIQRGGMATTLMLLAIIFLMVVKPQF
ncbi:MAG TPA: DUF2269 family protein [Candidatus Limnocylindrales bacterium]|jgi:uncharacterized membrane protein